MKQISFLINTSANTLSYVKLLLKSLKENLVGKEHEILIFVDSDNEGTVDYLRSIKKDFYDLKIITHKLNPCVGYSRNNNLLVELAKHDIVAYLQSDMLVSRGYDKAVLEDLEDDCILSVTRIEPPLHGPSDKTITADFGVDPDTFEWNKFLDFADSVKSDKQVEYFFAPFVFYKKTWLQFGGYDTLFRRSREDSDLLQRFIQGGIKIKQTFKANVYHFTCVTSRGKNWFDPNNTHAQERVKLQQIADAVELRRFVRRWGGFSHGENTLRKYDIDLVTDAKHEDLQTLINVEPYFSRVWVQSQETIDTAIRILTETEHVYANALLNFSEKDWKTSEPFYNKTDYTSIFRLGKPRDWNVRIEASLKDQNFVTLNPAIAYDLLSSTPEGSYETEDGVKIDIRNRSFIEPILRIRNPKFDMSLITIE